MKKYLNNKILFKYNNMENNKGVNYILNDSDDDDDDFVDEILENDKIFEAFSNLFFTNKAMKK